MLFIEWRHDDYLEHDPLLDVGQVGEVADRSETTHAEVKHLHTEERHQVGLTTLYTRQTASDMPDDPVHKTNSIK